MLADNSNSPETFDTSGVPYAQAPSEEIIDAITDAYAQHAAEIARKVGYRRKEYADYDAEDAVQDAAESMLIRAQSAGPELKTDDLGGYLAVSALNKLSDRSRRLSNRISRVSWDELMADWHVADDADPFADVQFASLWESISVHLTEGQRNVLLLTTIYGYSQEVTAKMLGLAEATVNSTKQRAMKKLRTVLQRGELDLQ